MAACGVPFEQLDARRGRARAGRRCALPDGTVALHQARHGDRAGRAVDRDDAAAGRGGRRPAARRAPGDRRCVAAGRRHAWRSRDGRRGRPPAVVPRAGRVVLTADAWTNELLAAPGHLAAADRDPRAGDLLRAGRRRSASAPDRLPVWIWMDDPSFYGFPTYAEGGNGAWSRRPGLRRSGDDGATSRSFDPDPRGARPAVAASPSGCCPASARRRARSPASTR